MTKITNFQQLTDNFATHFRVYSNRYNKRDLINFSSAYDRPPIVYSSDFYYFTLEVTLSLIMSADT